LITALMGPFQAISFLSLHASFPSSFLSAGNENSDKQMLNHD